MYVYMYIYIYVYTLNPLRVMQYPKHTKLNACKLK